MLRWRSNDLRPLETSQRAEDFEKAPRNPLDAITNYRQDYARRAYYIRRMKLAGIGLAASMLGLAIVCSQIDLTEEPSVSSATSTSSASSPFSRIEKADSAPLDAEKFQGKQVVIAPGGERLVAKDLSTGQDLDVVPTGTSKVPYFPKTIYIPTTAGNNEEDAEYTLIGQGIRSVSFLGVQVYVVGLYVSTSSLNSLQSSLIHHVNPTASTLIAGEKDTLKNTLLDPEKSYKLWEQLLKEDGSRIQTAFRVVPVKKTDFQHLRDGWVRGITTRTQEATQRAGASGATEFDDESFGQAMNDFKSLFRGRGSAPVGSVLLLTRDAAGSLGVLYADREGRGNLERLGELKDERISKLIWLNYLAGKKVSSEPARQDIARGAVALAERPLGTAERKVV